MKKVNTAMNGKIFNIQRFSVHDGPGARTTVFFKGCNLHCVWCHNPESIPTRSVVEFYPQKCIGCGACLSACQNGAQTVTIDLDSGESIHTINRENCIGCLTCTDTCYAGALAPVGKEVTADYVMKQIETDIPYYESSGGGVTFSGGECMMQIDFLAELLRRCKEKGIHTAVDTAGNLPRAYFEKIVDDTDLFLYDVKAADPAVHQALTGAKNDRILENLAWLAERGKRIIVRIPFIPTKNGGEMEKIAEILAKIRPELVEVLPFHKLGAAKYTALDLENPCEDEAAPTDEQVNAVLGILQNAGLNARRT